MADQSNLSINVGHPAPHRERVSLSTLWFGIAAAPLAWVTQLLFSVGLSGYDCYPHALPRAEPLWRGLTPVLLIIDVAAFVMALAGGWAAWKNWQRTKEERPGSVHDLMDVGDGRTRFMAMCGLLTSSLFLAALTFATIAFGVVPLCGHQ